MITPLGKRIRSRLRELSQTQSWLAKQAKLSPAQITHIIKGQKGTSINKLIDIGTILSMSPEEVVRLYRSEKTGKKSGIRKIIELDLDRIERLDKKQLHYVAHYVGLISRNIANTTE